MALVQSELLLSALLTTSFLDRSPTHDKKKIWIGFYPFLPCGHEPKLGFFLLWTKNVFCNLRNIYKLKLIWLIILLAVSFPFAHNECMRLDLCRKCNPQGVLLYFQSYIWKNVMTYIFRFMKAMHCTIYY